MTRESTTISVLLSSFRTEAISTTIQQSKGRGDLFMYTVHKYILVQCTQGDAVCCHLTCRNQLVPRLRVMTITIYIHHHCLFCSSVFTSSLPHSNAYQERWQLSIQSCATQQKQIGCFNHRVITLVGDKLKRQWLCIVYFANCIRQPERKLSRPSIYNLIL